MRDDRQQLAEAPRDDLPQWVDRSASRRVTVTEDLIAAFAAVSGDHSPIHVDETFAQRRGLKGRVAHGALQAALVSGVLGMDLPGAAGTLQELSLRFHRPCYASDTLTITVTVTECFCSVRAIRMAVRIVNQHAQVVATGKAQSGIAAS